MDELGFRQSAALTLGVEIELQLVRPHDMDLSRDAADLLARLSKRKLPGAVKPEITESMIELNSSVHAGSAALLEELEQEQIVRDALASLTPRCREMIRLLFYEHPPLPYKEVAKRLGLATGSIGFIRGRCLKRLAKALEKAGF